MSDSITDELIEQLDKLYPQLRSRLIKLQHEVADLEETNERLRATIEQLIQEKANER